MMRSRRQPQPSTPEPEPTTHYFEIDVTPVERALLLDALARHPKVTDTRRDLLMKVETATRVDLPLSDKLLWEELEREAFKRGCSWEDAWFDLIRKREAAR